MNANSATSVPQTERRSPFQFFALPLFIFLLLFSFGCAKKSDNYARPQLPVSPQSANQKKVNSILKTAFSQMGNPYRYGGSAPETGFDCSGFVGWVYKQYGVSLPRSSRDMMAVGTPIDKEDLRPGDLVFFNYGYSHVGIYTGNDKYIHSPRTGKTITESDLNGRGRKERFVAARRIIDNQGISTISERLKAEWISQSRHQARLALNEKNGRGVATTSSRLSGQTASRGSGSRIAVNSKNVAGAKIKVASGDTLVALAKKHGVTTQELVAANNLRDKHRLRLGQVLIVPQKAKVTPVAKSANNKNLTAKASPKKPSVKAKNSRAKSRVKVKTNSKSRGGTKVSTRKSAAPTKASAKAAAKSPAKGANKVAAKSPAKGANKVAGKSSTRASNKVVAKAAVKNKAKTTRR
ncbi:MAG: C40 family peptidase [Deltaproteobacteria bacterium]|jgi:LysM repeat protein|nr:C40 family peptidase [Deltaproteobacteria bacterium]